MNAIKQVRQFLLDHSESASARGLARLTEALAEETEFSLAALYELNAEAFELAIQLLQDWRLDRYYASRIKLFDVVLNEAHRVANGDALVGEAAENSAA
jgi:flagellar biosynthesis/type III secretory pathway protein FliH